MSKNCGNCLYCNSENYCVPKESHVSPEREGCHLHDFKEGSVPEIEEAAFDDELAVETERVVEDESVEQGKKVKRAIKLNRKDKKQKIIELYEKGLSYKEMQTRLGYSNHSSLTQRISELIKDGLVEPRNKRKETKPVTNSNEQKGAVIIGSSRAGASIKDSPTQEVQALSDNNSVIPVEQSDKSFIEDLLIGADKIIIYRKSITATIEFN